MRRQDCQEATASIRRYAARAAVLRDEAAMFVDESQAVLRYEQTHCYHAARRREHTCYSTRCRESVGTGYALGNTTSMSPYAMIMFYVAATPVDAASYTKSVNSSAIIAAARGVVAYSATDGRDALRVLRVYAAR